jgi:endonuclease YncB( thermonuclease family)
MSLNRRRRIFRSDPGPTPVFGGGVSRRVVMIVALCGAATSVAVIALPVPSAHAPAQALAADSLRNDAGHQQLSGPADALAVIDGDTLRIGEHVVRLEGIAAPARGSVCHGATSGDMDCGVAAANTLAALLRDKPVACTVHGSDPLGRPVAACLSAGVPLSQALVRRGWAHAQTAALRQTEEAARADGVGMWHSLGGS